MFCFFFLIIDLSLLIPAVTAQIFISAAEIAEIPIGIPTKEAKADMETHLVNTEAKISIKCNLKLYKLLLFFLGAVCMR